MLKMENTSRAVHLAASNFHCNWRYNYLARWGGEVLLMRHAQLHLNWAATNKRLKEVQFLRGSSLCD